MQMQTTLLSFLSIMIFSLVYLVDSKLHHFIDDKTLSSFAAGFGVVYIFIRMLPQLAHGQLVLEKNLENIEFSGSSYIIYIIALAGFYFLDQTLIHTDQIPAKAYDKKKERQIYLPNVLFLSIYNMLIGYVVGSYSLNNTSYQLIFLIAYYIHFIALKWGIYRLSPRLYKEKARYIIVSGLFLGYFTALLFNISEHVFIIIEAFITGCMILIVFKYELSTGQNIKKSSFVLGFLLSLLLFISL